MNSLPASVVGIRVMAAGKSVLAVAARAAERASFHNYHKISQCSEAPHYRLDIAFYSSFPRCRAETEEPDSLRQAIISTGATAKKPKLRVNWTRSIQKPFQKDVVISFRSELQPL